MSVRHTLTGDFRVHERFHSRHLGNDRTVLIYLPREYEGESARRYPVMYMQDGQNLFDRDTAFSDEWGLDETANRLVEDGRMTPTIIVGIYNSGDERIDEYTPTRDKRRRRGGKGDLYGKFLVEELKPYIDDIYRTLPSGRSTALGGSSLGGLITMYLGMRYPTVFGKLAVMSPSVWWDRKAIVRLARKLEAPRKQRIWLDAGTEEGADVVADARTLRDALLSKGWTLDRNLRYVEVTGGDHSERSWGARVGGVLKFLFPPRERRTTDREW